MNNLAEAQPTKKFDRHPSLAQSQIINYKASPDGKWLLLNGIAGGAQGITGQLQLFSVERNVSQPVPAHAGTFATIAADEAEIFCFADKAGAGGTVRSVPSVSAAAAAALAVFLLLLCTCGEVGRGKEQGRVL
jgi:clathrin heavy chain